MAIYVVLTNYMNNGFFGTYSSVLKARKAFEHFLAVDENVVSVEDCGGYGYHFVLKNGEEYGADIEWDVIDAEFIEGIVKEDK